VTANNPNPELLDEDNPEWSAQDVAKARPASEVLPQLFGAKVVQHLMRNLGGFFVSSSECKPW
jgi:hypothetical protein